jgi:hypothetical protein
MGLIYLDSCLLIYCIENDPIWAPRVTAAMSGEPADGFGISPLVKLECLIKPLRTADLGLQGRYEAGLRQFAPLPMPEIVYLKAAQLRASFGLRTPDALHLACAQHHGCRSIWTNDDRLARAGHGLARQIH